MMTALAFTALHVSLMRTLSPFLGFATPGGRPRFIDDRPARFNFRAVLLITQKVAMLNCADS